MSSYVEQCSSIKTVYQHTTKVRNITIIKQLQTCNSMNVILGLCHSCSGKVVTFQESLFACKRKLSKSRPYSQPSTETRDSTCPRSTAKFYLSVSHVIAVVRRAVTQPRQSGQLPVAARRRRCDVFESLRL